MTHSMPPNTSFITAIMHRSTGNAALFIVLILPLLVALVVLMTSVVHRVVNKLTLQVAADRAAYAGAKKLSEIMNAVAGKNWAIHQKFVAFEREMTATTMRQSQREGEQRHRQIQREIDDLREAMDALVAHGYQEACMVALAAATRWAPGAQLTPLYGHVRVEGDGPDRHCVDGLPLFRFGLPGQPVDQVEPAAQWPAVEYHWPEGGEGFPDPAEVQSATARLLAYRMKAPRWPDGPSDRVAFAVRLAEAAPPTMLPQLFSNRPDLHAAAAAQPYGGSIKATAFVDADTEEDARTAISYQPALVPLAALRETAQGYQGLQYWDDAEQGWVDDATVYLH